MSDRRIGRREALKITALAGVSAALGGSLAVGILRQAGLHRVSETRTRMGTLVTITVVHPDGDAARAMVGDSFGEMERLERILSRHDRSTPVGRLNTTGRLEAPPLELVEVLTRAHGYSEVSGGAFDVTIGPLLRLCEQTFASGGRGPSDVEIASASRLVDFNRLSLDGDVIRFEERDMSVTLDGIGKGYIVDRTLDVLVAAGADRVLVDAGGDVATGGPSSGRDPWTVGIHDPHGDTDFLGLVRLGGECIATSGDYMRTFTDDRRAHHILDPRTGRSPEATSSVSVVAGTAMDADALSTTVLVLGPAAGVALLEETQGVEGLVVDKEGRQYSTPGLARHAV